MNSFGLGSSFSFLGGDISCALLAEADSSAKLPSSSGTFSLDFALILLRDFIGDLRPAVLTSSGELIGSGFGTLNDLVYTLSYGLGTLLTNYGLGLSKLTIRSGITGAGPKLASLAAIIFSGSFFRYSVIICRCSMTSYWATASALTAFIAAVRVKFTFRALFLPPPALGTLY